MNEPIDNIGLIHGSCVKARHQHTQEQLSGVPPEELIGKCVKLAFPLGNIFEHIWVNVIGVAEDVDYDLRGTLDNDPIGTKIKYGDIFEFKISEVEEIYE